MESLIDILPAVVWPVVIGLLAAVTFVLVNRNQLMGAPTNVKWSISESWTSDLAAVIGVLGVVLGTTLLDEDIGRLTKQEFVGLDLAFGLLVVVAPLAWGALRRDGVGTCEGYLVSAGLAIWAAIGVLATLCFGLSGIHWGWAIVVASCLVTVMLFFYVRQEFISASSANKNEHVSLI